MWNDSNLVDHEQKLRFDSMTNKISKWFTAAVLIIAIGALLYWLPQNPETAVLVFTSVLIVACPCALALAAPITFGQTLRMLGNSKLYFKDTLAVERFGTVNQIVFDKTGTLTQSHSANISYHGEKLSPEDQSVVRSALRNSYHPLSLNLYYFLNGTPTLKIGHFEEFPGKGIEVVHHKKVYRIGSREFCHFPESEDDVLKTRVFIEIDSNLIGYFVFSNQYRPGLKNVVKKLHNYTLSLITGDNQSEKNTLKKYFGKRCTMLFKQNPVDKLNYIKSLQQNNNSVLMIGDGLNDAGALAQSDVGISVSEDTNNFSPACDGILDASQFNKLPQFIRFSKDAITTVKISIGVSFLYNVVGLSFAVQGMLSPLLSAVLMPTSSISVVLISSLIIKVYAKKLRA